MIVRFLEMIAVGLIVLAALYRFAMLIFPSLSDGLPMIFIFLAIIWCAVGLFMMSGELLTKYRKSDDDDKASNHTMKPTAPLRNKFSLLSIKRISRDRMRFAQRRVLLD